MHFEAHPHGEDLTSLFPVIVDESELSVYSEDDLVEELDADDEAPGEIDDLLDARAGAASDLERTAGRDELAAFHTRDSEPANHRELAASSTRYAMSELDRRRYARAVKAALDRDAARSDLHASESATDHDAEGDDLHARAIALDHDAEPDPTPEQSDLSDLSDESDEPDDVDDDPCEVAPLARRRALTLAERARELGARVAMRVLVPVAAIAMLVIAMGGTWTTAGATPVNPWAATRPPDPPSARVSRTGASSANTAPSGSTAGSANGSGSGNAVEGDAPIYRAKSGHGALSGKLNLNTASEDQLMLLPTVGPAKAERIVTWRKKNGGFKRAADLRRVKGFGYKTFKKLEPFLDTKGETTLVPK